MRLLQNNYFSVELIRNTSTNIINKPNQYWLASVINGNGQINNQMVGKGDSFIIPSSISNLKLNSDLELIITYESNVK
jgi:mannose-6-phosphate isomerase class I